MKTSTSTPISSGRNLLLLALSFLIATGSIACSDPSIEGTGNVSFVAEPASLLFTNIDQGDFQQQTLVVRNNGGSDLTLSNIELVNTTGNSLSPVGDWDDVTVEPDGAIDLTVEYAPQDEDQHEGYITIETNDLQLASEFACNPGDGDGLACIPVETQGFAPELHVSRTQVPFQAPPDGLDENYVQLRNIGGGTLDISRIEVTDGQQDYAISFFEELDGGDMPQPRSDDRTEAPTVLEPGEGIFMRVIFTPDDEDPSYGNVRIESNDPFQSTLDIELLGNTGAPCLEVVEASDGTIDFGPGSIHATNYQTVTLRNCSPQEDLDIDEISISVDSGGVFFINDEHLPADLPDSSAILAPYEVTTMLVGFAPEVAEETYNGEMYISSNDHIEPETYIPLTGVGVDSVCPIAEVAGAVGQAPPDNPVIATNQDVVNLTAAGSNDPDGGPLTYEWSVIDGPGGSLSEVVPSNVEEPQFTVDIVGNFVIELTVYDDTGLSNCDPAILEIWATPMEDIHVQLVWTSPQVEAEGGVDPTVQRGTDLDLHYVRPGGSWGDPFNSLYWDYPEQDWNGDGSFNANLDIDDLWGSDPENMNHADPEIGDHEVGVHFYRDNCWGPADATVRIYFGEMLIEEMTGRLNQTDNFWYVGTVDWQGTPQNSTFNVFNQFADTHALTSYWDLPLVNPGDC